MKASTLTPICDFLTRYRDADGVRLHMPGHKGKGELGVESIDLTEVEGADSLYHAHGIIRESERIASKIWGCHTFYVTEGSSQAIRAMVYLAALHAKERGKHPRLLAGRNAHKAFASAVAWVGCDVEWLAGDGSYLSCPVTPSILERALDKTPATAVYITSPDYLGNRADIAALSAVCHRKGALLMVDNAHGAYLKWMTPSMHPVDLGADMCCDSAHKTLPALTGCAYLHVAWEAPEGLAQNAKTALESFGSTSPSYLQLASLDALNGKLPAMGEDIRKTAATLTLLKNTLLYKGMELAGDEPCKLTLAPKSWGYTGEGVANILRERGIEPEFADPDHLVLMPSAMTSDHDWDRLKEALLDLPRLAPIDRRPPVMKLPRFAMSLRQAMLSPSVEIPVSQAEGRVLAYSTIGCPPAVPILVGGEVVDQEAIAAFRYYGIERIKVVK